MIAIDFDYYLPNHSTEAVSLFNDLDIINKKPVYYSGGTEIISMARVGNVDTEAVIDIKNIDELKTLKLSHDKLIIGSAVELNKITESNLFPLLGQTVKRIADHTMQCKITIGGNILGTIIYKEGILPLLLSDAILCVQGKDGESLKKIVDIYDKKVNLKNGELLKSIIIDAKYLSMPFVHIKKNKIEKIDYPLITINAINDNNYIKVAFSGLCKSPIRSLEIEKIINSPDFSIDKDFNNILNSLSMPILNNHSGTPEYRVFVLKELISKAMALKC